MKERGITLIALIITIIVMLILAAVSITMAVNGGLFGYAKNASTETEEAKAIELDWGTGIIGGKTIDEWVLGDDTDPLGIKYVNYKGTTFITAETGEDTYTLYPLAFPDENNYMLSGKYIEDELGNKVSVNPETTGAIADSNFEAFETRIAEELDNACQAKFGRSDGKIVAWNSREEVQLIAIYEMIFNAFGQYAQENNYIEAEDVLEDLIKITDCFLVKSTGASKNEIIQSISDFVFESNVTQIAGAFMGYITSLLENCNLGIEEPTEEEISIIISDVTDLLNGTKTFSEIEEYDRLTKDLINIIYDIYPIFMISVLEGFWIPSCQEVTDFYNGDGTSGMTYDYAWLVNAPGLVIDDWESPYLYMWNEDENDNNNITDENWDTRELSLAPILTVDKSLLQKTGDGTYIIAE